MTQYDQHWANPKETQPIWLGMTYAMMLIAVQSYQRAGDEPLEYRGRVPQLLEDYRRLTAQCLILADITQPIYHMLETLILYVVAEFGRSRDAEVGILIGITVIVRLAMRMGYHRDSKDFPNLTPFQGEVRELYQIGTPSNIADVNTDASPDMVSCPSSGSALFHSSRLASISPTCRYEHRFAFEYLRR